MDRITKLDLHVFTNKYGNRNSNKRIFEVFKDSKGQEKNHINIL